MENDIGTILAESRIKSKKSQEYMAAQLKVAKNTVSNWERGVSEPTIKQVLLWYRIIGQNPFPEMLRYAYPDTFNIKPDASDEELTQALHCCIDSMPPLIQRQMAYMLFADHGSSPFGIMQMMTAHLHTDMRSRVAVAKSIYNNYTLAEEMGELVQPDQILPDLDLLRQSVNMGKTAAVNKEPGYSSNHV